MPTAVCCRSSSLFLPANSRVSLLKRPILRLSLNGASPRVRFQSRFPINKWRFSCYRRENFSSEDPSSEHIEDEFSEDLVKPNHDQSIDLNRDWLSSIHKGVNLILGMKPWTVPWTEKTIVQVMLLWIASFWLVGSWIVPFLACTAGFRKESYTYRGQALYSLSTDVAEGLVGIAILRRCLAKFRPFPSNWFKFKLRQVAFRRWSWLPHVPPHQPAVTSESKFTAHSSIHSCDYFKRRTVSCAERTGGNGPLCSGGLSL